MKKVEQESGRFFKRRAGKIVRYPLPTDIQTDRPTDKRANSTAVKTILLSFVLCDLRIILAENSFFVTELHGSVGM